MTSIHLAIVSSPLDIMSNTPIGAMVNDLAARDELVHVVPFQPISWFKGLFYHPQHPLDWEHFGRQVQIATNCRGNTLRSALPETVYSTPYKQIIYAAAPLSTVAQELIACFPNTHITILPPTNNAAS